MGILGFRSSLPTVANPPPMSGTTFVACCLAATGDIGWVDPESLRALLWHCNAEQLAMVEDETR